MEDIEMIPGACLVVEPVPVRRLFGMAALFGREGNVTFGGGIATVAALQRELVNSKRWLDEEQSSMCVALARFTPGTVLLAFCTGAGWLLGRWKGALTALLAGSIPSALLVALMTGCFDLWSSQKLVQVAVSAVLASSVGILLSAFWTTIRPYMKAGRRGQSLAMVAGSIVLAMVGHLNPILILLLAATAGYFLKEEQQA